MGSSTSSNVPGTQGRSNLGDYTKVLTNQPQVGPDQQALAAYNNIFGNKPSYAQMANAHALQMINSLPLQHGSYLVSPGSIVQTGDSAVTNRFKQEPYKQPVRPSTKEQ